MLYIKKLFKILGEVWFYSISIYLIFVAVNILNGSNDWRIILKEGVFAFFPILISQNYWFVTAYIILMILSPFFNKLIYAMDRHTYSIFLLAIIIIFVIIDGGFPIVLTGMSDGRLIPVFIMYFLAGYIKKYITIKKNNASKHILVAVFMYVLLYASVIAFDVVGDMLNSKSILLHCYFYRPLNSPFVVVICIELFLGFLGFSPKENKIVNMIAKTTFGIYLLHGNRIILSFLLPKIFPVYKETNPLLVLLYSIGSVVIVFVVCTIIDLIRQATVEKLFLKLLNKYLDAARNKIIKIFDRMLVYTETVLKWYYR